jgi:hypothetical protein
MNSVRIRVMVTALVCAATLLTGSATATLAQQNNQQGLVNVNLQDLALAIPVSVAVPVGVAANVCGLNVAAIQEAGNECEAVNNSEALSQAIANQMLGTGGGPGGGARNNQEGLVNVNIQNLALAVPVSVSLPIGVAANVCGVNVLAIQQAGNTCDAQNTSEALSAALARQLIA